MSDDSENDYYGLYDSVCSFCDDGGDVLFCHGPCFRCFHPTIKTGLESQCQSLGFKDAADFQADSTEKEAMSDDSENDYYGLYDSVCSFCDDGGDVLFCHGPCFRCFHPTIKTGLESQCQSLGFKDAADFQTIETFFCNNCYHEKHQCFLCGMLGSSSTNSLAEVFRCSSACCGYYYHPACIANKLYPADKKLATATANQIAMGEPFTCPVHKCHSCGGVENRSEYEMQFATCKRCPKSYHRQCLPRSISFTNSPDGRIQQRAWDNLLSNRILMYCITQEDTGVPTEMLTEKRSKLFGNTEVHVSPKRAACVDAFPSAPLSHARPNLLLAPAATLLSLHHSQQRHSAVSHDA